MLHGKEIKSKALAKMLYVLVRVFGKDTASSSLLSGAMVLAGPPCLDVFAG